jgi:uncharacterized membrane-anchored protein
MKRALFVVASLAVLLVLDLLVVDHYRLFSTGAVIRLELAPRDPRALLQGDYMALTYRLSWDIPGQQRDQAPGSGVLIVELDGRHIARFVRFEDGSPLAPGEHRLRYEKRAAGASPWSLLFGRSGEIWPGPNAWFFEEGQAGTYQNARYAELRVSPSGRRILARLLDADLEPLAADAAPGE